MNHDCECREGDEFEGRTYLYIRTHPEDQGVEPRPANMCCVVSPDITIIQPDGTKGNEAIAGKVNHIEVVVTNKGGIDANDAYVEVFFGGPSTGFVATLAQKIGSVYVTIQGYSTSTARIPWVPLESDSGHLCLTARVSLVAPPDTYRDPSLFDIYNDRHLAQRNCHVVDLGGEKNFSFEFNLINPDRDNNGELMLQVKFINARHMEDTVNGVLGSDFAHFSNTLLGKIRVEVNGEEARSREPGMYSVYVPHNSLQKAKLYVEVFDEYDDMCQELHLLEVRLITYNYITIGGLWLIIKP